MMERKEYGLLNHTDLDLSPTSATFDPCDPQKDV